MNATLHSLTTLKRMTKESASELEQLYSNIMQLYRTLDTLQYPVAYRDDVFVFIAVQRLDSETVKAWEHYVGSSKEPPSWEQLSEFLVTRMFSLQAIERWKLERKIIRELLKLITRGNLRIKLSNWKRVTHSHVSSVIRNTKQPDVRHITRRSFHNDES